MSFPPKPKPIPSKKPITTSSVHNKKIISTSTIIPSRTAPIPAVRSTIATANRVKTPIPPVKTAVKTNPSITTTKQQIHSTSSTTTSTPTTESNSLLINQYLLLSLSQQSKLSNQTYNATRLKLLEGIAILELKVGEKLTRSKLENELKLLDELDALEEVDGGSVRAVLEEGARLVSASKELIEEMERKEDWIERVYSTQLELDKMSSTLNKLKFEKQFSSISSLVDSLSNSISAQLQKLGILRA